MKCSHNTSKLQPSFRQFHLKMAAHFKVSAVNWLTFVKATYENKMYPF